MRKFNLSTSPLSLLTLLCVLAFSSSADAGTLGGRILNTGGAGVGGLQVQLWAQQGKNFSLNTTVTSAGNGSYSFTGVRGGNYRVSVRMPPGMDGNWTDRWLDIAAPTSDGWAGFAADTIAVANDGTSNGLDITVAAGGGVDVHINQNGTRTAGLMARIERASNVTQHHHDVSDAAVSASTDPYLGRAHFRGLEAASDYRIMLFDIDARLETRFFGPYTVSGTGVTDIGTLNVEAMGEDPYEPNNVATATGSASIPSGLFRGEIPEPFESFGALIGPRNEDIDYYCLEVQDHDRFLASTSTDLALEGEFTDHPYTDIMLAFVSGDGSRIVAQDDDSGGGMNAALDTGDIPNGGRYCFVVTTYGDTSFRGANQESAGRYDLTIELGNRVPSIVVTRDGGPIPEPPGRTIVEEGSRFRIDIQVSDPDNDPLDITIGHYDNTGAEVPIGDFEMGPDGRGTYGWDVPNNGASFAPYEIIITATDGEFSIQDPILVDPNGVNLSPTMPVLVSPVGGATVATWTPELVINNAEDPDFDPLTYEYEIYYGDPTGAPDEEGVVPQDPEDESGTTTYITTPIEENQAVSWRARANDMITESGVSPWTEFETFIVNVENEPPYDINLVKPDNGATVASRRPALSVENTRDPDGDQLVFFFEVAHDSDFTDMVVVSPEVPQSDVGTLTTWNVEPALVWGTTYYARAMASDPVGASTPYSNVREFRVKDNQSPQEPTLTGQLGAQCTGLVYGESIPTEFTVAPVVDPEGEAVTIYFYVFDYTADVTNDEPLYEEVRVQGEGHTGDHVFVVPEDLFVENGRYVIRLRATDGERDSVWTECNFRIDAENSVPTDLVIIEPQPGTVFPGATNEVRFLLQNAEDEDGADLTIAWCAVNTLAEDDVCPEDFRQWRTVPQSPSGETEFFLEGLFPGAAVSVQACAFDDNGVCGPTASTSFTIEILKTEVTPTLCGCNATLSSSNDTKAWLLLWGVVFVAMRRRPRGGAQRA